jgi:hypothetical protein
MTFEHTSRPALRRLSRVTLQRMSVAAVLVLGACTTVAPLPAPRSLIVRSGARLQPDQARLSQIDLWLRDQQQNITLDPSFMIIENPTPVETYPWDGLTISEDADTAYVLVPSVAPESGSIMAFYGHYHLMKKMERLDEFLPEAAEAEGYELERAILARVADAWLYGRALFDMTPYGPLDELMYAREHDYLEAMILTSRPDEFDAERTAWMDANPGKQEEYRSWFMETFEREPPGLR